MFFSLSLSLSLSVKFCIVFHEKLGLFYVRFLTTYSNLGFFFFIVYENLSTFVIFIYQEL